MKRYVLTMLLAIVISGMIAPINSMANTVSENAVGEETIIVLDGENESEGTTVTPSDEVVVPETASIVHEGTCGDLYWTIDSNGLFTIEGTGDYGNSNWNAYKNKIYSAKIDVPSSKKKAYKKLFKAATGYKKTMSVK